MAMVGVCRLNLSLSDLPDELLLRVLYFLDVPELLSTSRVSRPQNREYC